jgi:NDP-sugar pyrophosphorylase family protein
MPVKLYIEFDEVSGWNDDVIYWTVGWLYSHGYAFDFKEYDYTGEWSVDIYSKGLELVDVFEFVFDGFGDAIRHFAESLNYGIAVAVCEGDSCIDVNFEDLKNLEKQEHLEVEERWQRLIEPVVYGEDDDSEYREYVEAVKFERLMGLMNNGDVLDAVLEQEDYE